MAGKTYALNKSTIRQFIKSELEAKPLDVRKQRFMWFLEPTGLGLRFTKRADGSHSVAWVFQRRVREDEKSKPRRITLNSIYLEGNDDSIEHARLEAAELATLSRKGINPHVHRQALATATQDAKRAEDIKRDAESRPIRNYFHIYLETNKCHWGARYLKDQYSYIQPPGGKLRKRGRTSTGSKVEGPLYQLMELTPGKLKREWIREWILKEREVRPTVLAGATRVLKTFLRWLDEHEDYRGLIDPMIINAREITRLIPKPKSRERALQNIQLAPFVKAVVELEGRFLASRAILVCLLTGARINEVLAMEWANVDFKWKTLRIRDKVEATRVIPLTQMLGKVLEEVRFYNENKKFINFRNGKVERQPSPWVFFAERSKSGHMEDISRALNLALGASKIQNISAHDLRRSYTTLSEWPNIPQGVVAQIQGHKPSGTVELHYKKRPIDLLRKYAQVYEDWLVKESNFAEVFEKNKLIFERPEVLPNPIKGLQTCAISESANTVARTQATVALIANAIEAN